MKQEQCTENVVKVRVASHVEAWIETVNLTFLTNFFLVASHVEAWIETTIMKTIKITEDGRLPRGGVD